MKGYLSFFCTNCGTKYYIENVTRCDNKFTAFLKCPNSHWWHRHPTLILYSSDSGQTWNRGDTCTYLIPSIIAREALTCLEKNLVIGGLLKRF